jgi:hypothetical protein
LSTTLQQWDWIRMLQITPNTSPISPSQKDCSVMPWIRAEGAQILSEKYIAKPKVKKGCRKDNRGIYNSNTCGPSKH